MNDATYEKAMEIVSRLRDAINEAACLIEAARKHGGHTAKGKRFDPGSVASASE